jgi:hypothetical protein
MRGHFNDLLLIPAALPMVLWVQRRIKIRTDDGVPTWSEIVFHLFIWSFICEFIGPNYFSQGTADLWDVVAYSVGGFMAGAWWNYHHWSKLKF